MDWIYRLLYLYRYLALHMYMRINATKKTLCYLTYGNCRPSASEVVF